eukprot:TRINITY_DN10565_c0_g1_i1.p1 TRINITY_DN10565_c0_g1~~TRINITY_DN10565_c0_g1_i1.p1  ORF type:complete len:1051 (+),score=154.39 TRINITY_DN10565_c0_g1_i1:32-3154(+)
MDMEQAVLQALPQLREEGSARSQAEAVLKQIAATAPGFGVLLTQIFLKDDVPEDLRQLAGILLKYYVKEQWDAMCEKLNGRRVPTDEEKTAIKQQLPEGLQSANVKIRTVSSMCIASIAAWDWPAAWPGLVQSLVQCLTSANVNVVLGAIACLEMFASGENLSDQQLPRLIELAFPALLQVVASSPTHFPLRVKTQAVRVITSCLNWLTVTKEVMQHSAGIKPMRGVMAKWLAVVTDQLRQPHAHYYYGYHIEMLELVNILIVSFPSLVKGAIEPLLAMVSTLLHQTYPVYLRRAIYSDQLQEMELKHGESKESVGIENFVTKLLDVLHNLTFKNKFRPLLQSSLHSVFVATLGYLQMTEEQVEQYIDDPGAWMADEEDDLRVFSVRITCQQLLVECFEGYKHAAFAPFGAALVQLLQSSEQMKKQDHVHWWKLHEACVCGFGKVASYYVHQKASTFNMETFVKEVLGGDLTADTSKASVFLKGRALWCCSQLVPILPPHAAMPFLEAAATALSQTAADVPLPIKHYSCRLIANFAPKIPVADARQLIQNVMEPLFGLLDQSVEHTRILILESLALLLPISEPISQTALKPLISRILILWASENRNHLIVNCLIDIVRAFAALPACQNELQSLMAEPLANILSNPGNYKWNVLETAITFATVIIMPCSWPLHPLLGSAFFPALISFLTTTNEASALEGGADCLRAYVRVCGSHLLEWKVGDKNGLQMVVDVISRQLGPGVNDKSARKVGDLVEKVIVTFGSSVSSVLDYLLPAVLKRLHIAEHQSLQQGLLMVFVRLFHMDPDNIAEYLKSKDFTNCGMSELHFVLRRWTEQHDNFKGGFKIKMSALALIKLFTSNNPLFNVAVRGDLKVLNKRQTRAVAAAEHGGNLYAEEPLKLRIFKLLVKEHMVIFENEMDSFSMSESDEEVEWGSDDDDDAFAEKLFRNGPGANINSLADSFAAQSTMLELSDLLDEAHRDESPEEEEDPDIKADALYPIVLKDTIRDFLRSMAKQHAQVFQQLASTLQPVGQGHGKKHGLQRVS